MTISGTGTSTANSVDDSSSDGETGPASTSDSPATSESASSSGAPPVDPFCGDGNIDPGEECDDDDENALTAACRPDCTMATCGDGDIWAGIEGCDDGEGDNLLEVGACAPDCSRVIEERVITVGAGIDDGNLGANPVTAMDAQCDPGFSALFAVPGARQATNGTPYTADDPIDWPLQPFTAYVREDDELVWITDENPLLGVRDGASQPLLVEIRPPACGIQLPCPTWDGVTGLTSNWTNAVSNTCNGWTSASDAYSMAYGTGESTTAYLIGGGTVDCSIPITFNVSRAPYCVEQ